MIVYLTVLEYEVPSLGILTLRSSTRIQYRTHSYHSQRLQPSNGPQAGASLRDLSSPGPSRGHWSLSSPPTRGAFSLWAGRARHQERATRQQIRRLDAPVPLKQLAHAKVRSGMALVDVLGYPLLPGGAWNGNNNGRPLGVYWRLASDDHEGNMSNDDVITVLGNFTLLGRSGT